MSKSFSTITGDVSKALGTLRKEIPETMQGFNAMSKAALTAGALSALEKELIALATRVRQLIAQAIDCYRAAFKNVYYKRESCCG